MSPMKYTRLPMEDTESGPVFDYSSAFTFEGRDNVQWKYKSPFSYGSSSSVAKLNTSEITLPSSSDKLARILITIGFLIIYIFTFPVMVWFSFKKIPHYERLVVFRLGRLHKLKGPGFVFLLPLLDRCHKIDIRLKAFSVPPKQIITGDGAIIEVGAEIYFQIKDAEKSVTNVQNLDQSTRVLVQTSLCNILSHKALTDIEGERRIIADTVMVNSNKTSQSWGVEITRAELSQIKVLSGPPQKKPPTFVKPPGMFGAEDSSMPSALAHLAAALATSQGPGQTQAISQAIQTMMAGYLPDSDNLPVLMQDTNDLAAFLGSSDHERNQKQDAIYVSNEVTSAVAASSSSEHAPPPPPLVMSPDEVVCLIRMSLCENIVEKVQETYQFEILGAGAGTYYLDLKHGKGALDIGPDPSGDPSATLSLSFDDLQAMLLGQLKPFQAYMSGRLKISGDTAAALKLEELGKRMKSLTA